MGTNEETRRAHFYTWFPCMCVTSPALEYWADLRRCAPGKGVPLCFTNSPVLVLRLRKSAAGKSVLGTRRRKTSRPRGREVLSFMGFGMKSQQDVFGEWPATRPACWYNNQVNGRVATILAAWYDSGKRRDESGRTACWVSAELPFL